MDKRILLIGARAYACPSDPSHCLRVWGRPPVDKPHIIETRVIALWPRPRIHCVAAPHVERSANPRDTSHPLENDNDA